MSESRLAKEPQQVLDSWNSLVEEGDNRFVDVNYEALDNLAQENPDLEVPDWKFPGQHADNDWAFATQTIVSSVLNYAFLDKDVPGGGWEMQNPAKPEQTIVSSNALHTRVYQVFGESEDITGSQIMRLANAGAFEKFLPGIPMASSRKRLLAQFALGLNHEYGGSVRTLLESSVDNSGNMRAFNDGKGLVERLAAREFGGAFTDTSRLDDKKFPFLKRAQLAPLLVYGRAQSSDVLPAFADVEKIGPIVDYQLPRAFRHMDVLQYSPELAEHVDNWKMISAESRMEIELRAATAESVDYLLNKTNEIRANLGQSALNMAHVDFWLWTKGRALKKLENPPHPHFTETTAY